ncbi:hypothetical protein SAMN04489742_1689 [Arthrobacter crystallopoietes]|uniref:Uncharacterized protein n=1 Tax=Crystallibacter crystallopoietes TaxID=37928 RepID=A0A1H1C1L4_9MICC|nr:hypothetical protein SAMN04489742_1689 [Arthrobacter crystallopoietes]
MDGDYPERSKAFVTDEPLACQHDAMDGFFVKTRASLARCAEFLNFLNF